MAMSITELERALRALRLSGMSATLQAPALAVGTHEMDFVEAFSWLVQDELDRRRSRLLDRRYALSSQKLMRETDWQPATHFETGLATTISTPFRRQLLAARRRFSATSSRNAYWVCRRGRVDRDGHECFYAQPLAGF